MKDRLLILMRHAKSSWADASLPDSNRPLNERGRAAAPAIGNWLQEQAMVPDCILSSTATRAQQTSHLLLSTWIHPGKIIDVEELYRASPSTILDVIQRSAPPECRRLMVVGHNPGLENLASMLAGKAVSMPTAALAIFRLTGTSGWSKNLAPGALHFERLLVPREIHSSLGSD